MKPYDAIKRENNVFFFYYFVVGCDITFQSTFVKLKPGYKAAEQEVFFFVKLILISYVLISFLWFPVTFEHIVSFYFNLKLLVGVFRPEVHIFTLHTSILSVSLALRCSSNILTIFGNF